MHGYEIAILSPRDLSLEKRGESREERGREKRAKERREERREERGNMIEETGI